MEKKSSVQLFNKAKQYIPGGVNSPVRAFRGVGGTPVFIRSAKGAYLLDEDENSYLDMINSWGPMILGHAHPKVVEAVQHAIARSSSFGTPTRQEAEIAELLVENIDHLEQIRFVNSGTEACMSAIRLARGYTGKKFIIKFRGCYHGHADSFLVSAGSGLQTLNQSDSAGVPAEFVHFTLQADFNDIGSVQYLFEKYPAEIAAVIIEPVVGNMGCLVPQEGFLDQLQLICQENQSLLILDEVMTGFRLAFGGAAELFGLEPDMVCYGKIIGGGCPVGAFGGKLEIMECLAPEGPVYQAGTLSGNPISIAAGLATLHVLRKDPGIYSRLDSKTRKLANGLLEAFQESGIPMQVNQCGSMMSLFFSEIQPVDYESAKKTDTRVFAKFFHAMLDQGIYLPPSNFESWFVSDALEEEHMSLIIDVTREVIKKL